MSAGVPGVVCGPSIDERSEPPRVWAIVGATVRWWEPRFPATVLRPQTPLGTRRVGAGGARQEAPKHRFPIHPKTRRSVRRRRHSSYIDISICSFSDELMSEEPASPTPGQWSPATGRSTRREVAISMYRQIAPGRSERPRPRRPRLTRTIEGITNPLGAPAATRA